MGENLLMSIVCISGKNEYREKETLQRVLKENKIPSDKVVSFDASNGKDFNIDSVMIECNMFSLFDNEPKAVIVKNPYFLKASDSSKETGKKKKDTAKEHLLSVLEQYFQQPNESTALIFYLEGNDLDTRKKEAKLLDTYHVQKYVCAEIKYWEFPKHIDELLKKNHFILDARARQEFDQRIGTDEFQLHHAIEKMKLYGETTYDVSLIQQLIPEDTNLDIWKLGNALIAGNLAESIQQKEVLLAKGKTVNELFPLLTSQIRKAYNIALLYDRGYSNGQIATRLRMKETAVNMNLKSMRGRSSKSLLKMLVELADIDQGIKSGKYDPYAQLEYFLLKYGA